ncbi:PREDICTED: uncharacterized protein LOC105312873 [Amphimedon queenslandica]|nr:PREDICTED: uncharacterized protein LOC105312873 [Amphimedon queenslandica]|eukprot:XP_011404154.2 PREDICTED: uncharacterized protein LOC105312873 [Amphimedon queenslandica]
MMKVLLVAAFFLATSLLVESAAVDKAKLLRETVLNILNKPAVRRGGSVSDGLQETFAASSSCRYSSCDDATNQLSDNNTIVNCVTIFNHLFDGTGVSDSEVNTYCVQDHCGNDVKDVFDQVTACCQDPGLPANIIKAMDETCYTNANGDYCLKEDQLTTTIFIDNSSDKGSEYLTCTSLYQSDTSTCPTECSDVLTYITGTLGCCYKAMAGFFSPGPADLASDDLFTTCGYTPPTYCSARK